MSWRPSCSGSRPFISSPSSAGWPACSICRASSCTTPRRSPRSAESERFKVMERKLLKTIINPSMIAVWVLGLLLSFIIPGTWHEGWFHAKFALVLALSGLHGFLAASVRRFAADANTRFAALLAHRQRGPGLYHGADRHPGGREALLKPLFPARPCKAFARPPNRRYKRGQSPLRRRTVSHAKFRADTEPRENRRGSLLHPIDIREGPPAAPRGEADHPSPRMFR